MSDRDIQELVVEFHGICTHFHGDVLPGIPHRVVIPDATPAREGLLTGPFMRDRSVPADWITYKLAPHYTTIKMGVYNFTAAGLVSEGTLFTRSALRIENTIGEANEYDRTFKKDVPSLTDFVPNFAYSVSTVLEGRAAAYFDFQSGATFSAYKEGEEVRVRATVKTYGPPSLRITPFSPADQPLSTHVYPLKGNAAEPLVIANLAGTCKEGGDYDFLLHYLNEKGGIPRSLTERLPGMPRPKGHHSSDLGAGCSDSRYP